MNAAPRAAIATPSARFSREGADQAAGLLRHAARLSSRAEVLTVVSGKGGVGKTNIAVNLAVAAAASGRRVLVIDADLGLANAAEIMDVQPRWNLSHVLAGQVSAEDALVTGPAKVMLLPGASGLTRLADMGDEDRERLVDALAPLEKRADLIVVDTGAGIAANVIRMALAANRVLVVGTPEPPAIKDAYATIKTLGRSPVCPPLGLIINMADHAMDANRALDSVVRVARQYAGLEVRRMGWLIKDRSVALAVRRQRPFVLEFPSSPAACGLRALARELWGGRQAAVSPAPRASHAAPMSTASPVPPQSTGFFERLGRWFK